MFLFIKPRQTLGVCWVHVSSRTPTTKIISICSMQLRTMQYTTQYQQHLKVMNNFAKRDTDSLYRYLWLECNILLKSLTEKFLTYAGDIHQTLGGSDFSSRKKSKSKSIHFKKEMEWSIDSYKCHFWQSFQQSSVSFPNLSDYNSENGQSMRLRICESLKSVKGFNVLDCFINVFCLNV